ncbi:MAG: PUA domain-containing protein, partial [Elusimicrobiota bacterium]
IDSRKRWIAFGAKVKGGIIIDSGAAEAITKRNKSLLSSGVVSIEGNFNLGDNVSVTGADGKEVARGLVWFSSQDLAKIKGKKSSEIFRILGKSDYEEVIHKDNLVVL